MTDLPAGAVLVRAPNWIGDAVLATPVLDVLADHLHGRRIAVATRRPAIEVFRGHPRVSELIGVPSAGEERDLIRELARRRFALAVVLAPSFRAAWQVFRAGIPERWGYGAQLRGSLLTFCPAGRGRRPPVHQARDYLDLLAAAGLDTFPAPRPRVFPDAQDEASAEAVADMVSDGGRRPIVALNPGAVFGPTRRWPEERFAEVGLAAALAGAGIAVLGGPAEGELCGRVAHAIEIAAPNPGCAYAFAGSEALPIRAVTAFASRARLLLTNDTGPMHLWAAGGGRVVAVFGTSLPRLHGPVAVHARVFHRADLACAGCYSATCEHGIRCLADISAAEVARGVLAELEGRGPAWPIEMSMEVERDSFDVSHPPGIG